MGPVHARAPRPEVALSFQHSFIHFFMVRAKFSLSVFVFCNPEVALVTINALYGSENKSTANTNVLQ